MGGLGLIIKWVPHKGGPDFPGNLSSSLKCPHHVNKSKSESFISINTNIPRTRA